jgi:polar amino acid transport system substrate-binding protein
MEKFPGAAVVLLAVVLLYSAAAGAQAKTVRISTEDYRPYTSQDLEHYGIDARIVTEAFRLSGYVVDYLFLPGARSYDMAKEGRTDATLPWAMRAERRKDFFYSDPVLAVDHEHFFFRRGYAIDWDPHKQNYDDVKGAQVGAIISYNYGEKFQQAERDGVINVMRLRTLKSAFAMLLKDRLDLVISKRRVGRHVLRDNFSDLEIDSLDSRPENLRQSSYDFLLISKKSPHAKAILDGFNQGLAKMRANGTYKRFMDEFEAGLLARSL